MSSTISEPKLQPVSISVLNISPSYVYTVNSNNYANKTVPVYNGTDAKITTITVKFSDFPSQTYIKNWEVDFGDGSAKIGYKRESVTDLTVTTSKNNTTATLNSTSGLFPNQDYYISSSTIPVANQIYFTTGSTLTNSITLNSLFWDSLHTENYNIAAGTGAACVITPVWQKVTHKYRYGGPSVSGTEVVSPTPITLVGIDNYNRRVTHRAVVYPSSAV